MRKYTLLFAAALAMGLTACGNSNTNGGDTENGTAQQVSDDQQNPQTGGEAYTITVLDPDKASPRKEMKGTVGGAEVVVNYGSPSVKGRKIWGELEAWNKVWRAGANEATTVTFDTDVTINGEDLAAGKYAYFIQPNENDDWVVIFNTVADQWGAYNHDPEKDALRVNVAPDMVEDSQETLDYIIEGDQLIMRWENASVPVTVAAK